MLGGTGDLMQRKLLPAIYALARQGAIDHRSRILGVARRAMDDAAYRRLALDALRVHGGVEPDHAARWCQECLVYQPLGDADAGAYGRLAQRLTDLEREAGLAGNRVFYLALPPQAVPDTITALGGAGLNRSAGWTRLVFEKPFGRDLASARQLNRMVHRHFTERQVYRIDHYLGKETVQNLLVFRAANPLFETLWNRDRVAGVQITVAETVGVEDRADYYEESGAVRDIIQNHLTQLVTLVAMELPTDFDADAIRDEKVKVLQAVEPLRRAAAIFGQYAAGEIDGHPVPGYREEAGVAPDSARETFVAIRLGIANWRWHGVPFVIRTGKRLPRRTTYIVVRFREAPISIFRRFDQTAHTAPNVLVVTVQPDEGFDLHFDVKAPGQTMRLERQRLDFRYAEAFAPLPDAYETLLLDVLQGDQTLFVRADEVETSWRLYDPLLADPPATDLYPAGTWGPAAAERVADGGWFAP